MRAIAEPGQQRYQSTAAPPSSHALPPPGGLIDACTELFVNVTLSPCGAEQCIWCAAPKCL